MRVFVTGAAGFVGRYVVAAFQSAGADVVEATGPHQGADALDVTDATAVRERLLKARPDIVVHLAAQTFVPRSHEAPDETRAVNVEGTRTIAAVCAESQALLILASSAEVYGHVQPEQLPIVEATPLRPANPYAQSKADAEAVLHSMSGLRWIVARSFNAIGPGQDERFVVANFARQLARIARGAPPVMLVGNLEAKRDFVDVRDAAAAYVALAGRGTPGETYNVCAGSAYAIRDVLRELILAARVPVEVREDPARMRPSDVPLFVGDNAKLRALEWMPQFRLPQTLRDVYEAALAAAENEPGL